MRKQFKMYNDLLTLEAFRINWHIVEVTLECNGYTETTHFKVDNEDESLDVISLIDATELKDWTEETYEDLIFEWKQGCDEANEHLEDFENEQRKYL